MLLACIIDTRWEKHERFRDSQWDDSCKLVTIPFKSILSKSTWINLSCVTVDRLAYNLSHYSGEDHVGRRCSEARSRSREKGGRKRWMVSHICGTSPYMLLTCVHLVQCQDKPFPQAKSTYHTNKSVGCENVNDRRQRHLQNMQWLRIKHGKWLN